MVAAGSAFFARDKISLWKKQQKSKIEYDKKQHTYQIEYDLARRLLVSIYEYRDAVQAVRNPLISFTPVSANEEPQKSLDVRNFEAQQKVHFQRYDKVNKVGREIDAGVLESTVFWDDELKKITDKIGALNDDLSSNYKYYYNSKNPATSANKREVYGNMVNREILYAGRSNDKFSKDFDAVVKEAEDYLQQKMRQ